MFRFAIVLSLMVAAPLRSSDARAQQLPPQAGVAPYVSRGRQVEALQKTLADRTALFHDALAGVLRQAAPDLLPRLKPPPPIATGYQLLPRLVPDPTPVAVPTALQLVSYSWRWSETLMAQETATLERMEATLARTPAIAGSRAALDSLVTGYRGVVDRKKLVDADVNYNWLWQAEIDRARPIFDRTTTLQNLILAPKAPGDTTSRSVIERGLAESVARVDPPAFVRFERATEADWAVVVPLATDILDTAFVGVFKEAVEWRWQLKAPTGGYRVVLELRTLTPTALYCPRAGGAAPPDSTCAPPARGAAIDLRAHLARFPAGVAVLTTGAGSTHVTAGRAIVLSPHDATRSLLAHEFGHILGIRDAYLRGYRDAGADGYVVTELIVDHGDIMGNSRAGSVLPRHFERLLAVKDAQALMQAGLAALYERSDPRSAVERFREVLQRQPLHYGATFQLAKALDLDGKPAEAAVWWAQVLEAAELISDTATARHARARLAVRK